jgi:adenine-specific DNA-methyltransferase
MAGYRHEDAKRRNLPTDETERVMTDADRRAEFFEPETVIRTGRPVLSWMRNSDADAPVEGRPLYVQEKVEPASFAERLRREPGAGDNRSLFNGLPPEAAYEWYEHEGHWQNRIIRGPSQEVMGSLLAREEMAGTVQMVYYDPPYGIDYGKTIQTDMRTRDDDVKDKGTADAAMQKCFRDAYRRGIHSYLDGVARNLVLIRSLLADTGSVFVQIGKANVHRVAVLMDELFGEENRVATITVKKSGSSSSGTLSETADYLLWYAKDKPNVQYHDVYEPLNRDGILDQFRSYAMIEEPDGSSRPLTAEEKTSTTAIPGECRLFRRMPLDSIGVGKGSVAEPYEWNDKTWPVRPNRQWSVKHHGLDRLAELGRLVAAEDSNHLSWKKYENEVAGKALNNVWAENHAPNDLHYVVETAEKVIERCLWMTTNPGDLVLDPTCGSGTTAAMAEKWGRRWITIDAGAVSAAWARQRLITGVYDYYVTQDSPDGREAEAKRGNHVHVDGVEWHGFDDKGRMKSGPASGFVYERVPDVSAGILGYDGKLPPIFRVNDPAKARGKIRLTGPFTVEHHAPYRELIPPEDVSKLCDVGAKAAENIVSTMATTGILSGSRRMTVTDIVPDEGSGDAKSYAATYSCWVDGKRGELVVCPTDWTAGPRIVDRAMNTALERDTGIEHLILVAWAWEAHQRERTDRRGRLTIHQVQANQDLKLDQLTAKASDVAFVEIGEPDIDLEPTDDGRLFVKVNGYDSYNPKTGTVQPSDGRDIIYWAVDTDHDGKSFFATLMHFPLGIKDKQVQKFRAKLAQCPTMDAEKWEYSHGLTSMPFDPPGSGMIAVRITTATGTDISKTMPLTADAEKRI